MSENDTVIRTAVFELVEAAPPPPPLPRIEPTPSGAPRPRRRLAVLALGVGLAMLITGAVVISNRSNNDRGVVTATTPRGGPPAGDRAHVPDGDRILRPPRRPVERPGSRGVDHRPSVAGQPVRRSGRAVLREGRTPRPASSSVRAHRPQGVAGPAQPRMGRRARHRPAPRRGLSGRHAGQAVARVRRRLLRDETGLRPVDRQDRNEESAGPHRCRRPLPRPAATRTRQLIRATVAPQLDSGRLSVAIATVKRPETSQ